MLVNAAKGCDVFVGCVGSGIGTSFNGWDRLFNIGTEKRVGDRGVIRDSVLSQEKNRHICICSVKLRDRYPGIARPGRGIYKSE